MSYYFHIVNHNQNVHSKYQSTDWHIWCHATEYDTSVCIWVGYYDQMHQNPEQRGWWCMKVQLHALHQQLFVFCILYYCIFIFCILYRVFFVTGAPLKSVSMENLGKVDLRRRRLSQIHLTQPRLTFCTYNVQGGAPVKKNTLYFVFWHSGASRVAWMVRCGASGNGTWCSFMPFIGWHLYFVFCILTFVFWHSGVSVVAWRREWHTVQLRALHWDLYFAIGICILYFVFWHSGASRVAWMVHEGMAHGAASCLTLAGVARRAKVLPNPANMCQHYLTPPLPRIGPAPVQKGLNRRFCNIYGYTNS